jgi:hypothetical protein
MMLPFAHRETAMGKKNLLPRQSRGWLFGLPPSPGKRKQKEILRVLRVSAVQLSYMSLYL